MPMGRNVDEMFSQMVSQKSGSRQSGSCSSRSLVCNLPRNMVMFFRTDDKKVKGVKPKTEGVSDYLETNAEKL